VALALARGETSYKSTDSDPIRVDLSAGCTLNFESVPERTALIVCGTQVRYSAGYLSLILSKLDWNIGDLVHTQTALLSKPARTWPQIPMCVHTADVAVVFRIEH